MRGADVSLAPLKGARILAVRAGALGDTIVALPALAALRREAGPDGHLALVGAEPYVQLARSDRYASRVYSLDRGPFREDLPRVVSSFDIVVAWTRHTQLREAILAACIASLEAPPLPPKGVHASDHLLGTLSPFGIDGPAPPPVIGFSAETSARGDEWIASQGLGPHRFVALHPGSGSPKKNWPEQRFRELAELVLAAGLGLVWIAGEADGESVSWLEATVPSPVARQLDLRVLGAVLSHAYGYIGNDSGISHLAAASGAASVALFGPSDPLQWAPRGRKVGVVDWRSSASTVWGIARAVFGSS